MKMVQLEYFKAVAETGRVNLAAKKMCVTPSAISIAIEKLEKELGVQLFDRTPISVSLNDAGKRYLQSVNRVFETLEEAENVLRGGTLVFEKGMNIQPLLWLKCTKLKAKFGTYYKSA